LARKLSPQWTRLLLLSESSIYILRHATPDRIDVPNRERPLSETGHQQAQDIVPFLSGLGIASIHVSPFLRTRSTMQPFADAAGLPIQEREDLRESLDKEPIAEVSERLLGAIRKILVTHPSENLLICTHGGCTWGVIYHFDSSFDYDDYRTIRTPDMFRFFCRDGQLSLDTEFRFDPGAA
jgi:2,3-bisphosphoglycerate-dependent phosphoglycerate mutase